MLGSKITLGHPGGSGVWSQIDLANTSYFDIEVNHRWSYSQFGVLRWSMAGF